MKDAEVEILVIKLGAFGDFIMALGAFAALRSHYKDAQITLLTIPSLVGIAETSGYFDAVWADARRRDGGSNFATIRKLRQHRFDRVYDLQCNDRTNAYFQCLRPFPPQWSGRAWGCSDPDPNPNRNAAHGTDRYRLQLQHMGIAEVPDPDPAFVTADTRHLALPEPYVLLIPGSSVQHPEKRWPASHFIQLCARLLAAGMTPVLSGTLDDADATQAIAQSVPEARDLTGQTSVFQLGGLAERAAGAVGNDTGPMHLIAAKGCPSVVLYSGTTRPTQTGQRGPAVMILQENRLEDLSPDRVWEAVKNLQAAN